MLDTILEGDHPRNTTKMTAKLEIVKWWDAIKKKVLL
jgi:hypothetical protein